MEIKTANKSAYPPDNRNGSPSAKPWKRSFAWLSTLFIVSGSMFFLGLLVGRGTSPVRFDKVKVERDLTRLKNTFAVPSPDKTSDPPKLEFYDALKKQGDDKESVIKFIPKAPPLPVPKEETATDPGQKDTPEAEEKMPVDTMPHSPEVQPAPQPDETAKPVPQAEPPEKAKAPEEKSAEYTIQVAAFKQAEEADHLVKMLLEKGYPAYRTMGSVSAKGIWFRVRVGSYETREGAGPMLEALEREKLKGILITRE